MKPSLESLWTAFPDHPTYPTLKDLYTWLGGKAAANIDSPGFGANGITCASRLSVAFNAGGAPITRASATLAHATTIIAGDGSLIIFRVSEFRSYLLKTLGKPTTDNASPYDDSFKGKRGIIAFTSTGATRRGTSRSGTGRITARRTTITRPKSARPMPR